MNKFLYTIFKRIFLKFQHRSKFLGRARIEYPWELIRVSRKMRFRDGQRRVVRASGRPNEKISRGAIDDSDDRQSARLTWRCLASFERQQHEERRCSCARLATPASTNQLRRRTSARRNKSTGTFPRSYANPVERYYLWAFVSVATVPKRVEPTPSGLCVAPLDPRHRVRPEW